MIKFVIIDKQMMVALYGVNGFTLQFTTRESATELAQQMFGATTDFIIIQIKVANA